MKNLLNFKTLYSGLFIITTILFASCSSDENYDFPGDSKSRIYIPASAGTNVTTYQVIHTPVGSSGNVSLKFPVRCTQRMKSNVKVTVALDNSLIAAYNAKNEAKYAQVPDGVVNFENGTVTIPADSLASVDSVTVSLSKDALPKLKEAGGYLIPVVIKSADGYNSAVSTNMNATYLAIDILKDVDNIWDSATDNNITGSKVTDRSGWSATYDANGGDLNYVDGSPISMFDGIESWSSEWDCYFSKNPSMIIDLGKEYNITALFMSPTYSIKNSTFSLSNDGKTWSKQGEVLSEVNNVIFYSPVTARYIKWDLAESYWSIYEFNIYAK